MMSVQCLIVYVIDMDDSGGKCVLSGVCRISDNLSGSEVSPDLKVSALADTTRDPEYTYRYREPERTPYDSGDGDVDLAWTS